MQTFFSGLFFRQEDLRILLNHSNNGCWNQGKAFSSLLPNFKKNNLGVAQLDKKIIENSIKNAKRKYTHCAEWHSDNHTTVYILVEKILNEIKQET